jgi:hypothetical protein
MNVSTHGGAAGIRTEAACRETPDAAFTVMPAAILPQLYPSAVTRGQDGGVNSQWISICGILALGQRTGAGTTSLQTLAAGSMMAGSEPGICERCASHKPCAVTSLFYVGISLQAATGLPAPVARQRIDEALEHLDGIIRQIRDAAFTTHGDGTPLQPAPPSGAAAARSGPRQPGRAGTRAGAVEQEPAREAAR